MLLWNAVNLTTRPHGVTSCQTAIFIIITIRTSNLTRSTKVANDIFLVCNVKIRVWGPQTSPDRLMLQMTYFWYVMLKFVSNWGPQTSPDRLKLQMTYFWYVMLKFVSKWGPQTSPDWLMLQMTYFWYVMLKFVSEDLKPHLIDLCCKWHISGM